MHYQIRKSCRSYRDSIRDVDNIELTKLIARYDKTKSSSQAHPVKNETPGSITFQRAREVNFLIT